MQADLGEPTTVYLVRHGRTADTDEGHVRGGDTVGPELTAAGRSQVRRLAAELARPGRGAALITSPVLRAQQTAALLAEALELDPPIIDGDWSELRLGDWDGLGYSRIARRWPVEYEQWRGSTAVAPPGGESLDALGVRVGAALDRLLAEHPGRPVLVVTHTAPIRSVIARALDAGPAALWRLRLDPARVSVLRFWADGGCEVGGVNASAFSG